MKREAGEPSLPGKTSASIDLQHKEIEEGLKLGAGLRVVIL